MPNTLTSPPTAGDHLADMALLTSDGVHTSLSALTGNGFLLVFVYRGCWCAFCLRRLVDYRNRINAFAYSHIQLVALSTDTPAAASRMRLRLKLPFELLCDPDAALVKSWHLENPRDRGTARPAAILIDAHEVVRWVSQDDGYAAATVDDVLQQCSAITNGDARTREAPRRLRIPGITWWMRAMRNELQFGRGQAKHKTGTTNVVQR